MRPALIAALLAVAASPATALTLDGRLMQGSLVEGLAAPGAHVSLDGRPVRVGADGSFLIAFGHDAKPEATLEILYADGSAGVKALPIERRTWDIQRIEGLPEPMVTPKPESIARIRDDNRQIAEVRAIDSPTAWYRSGFAWPVTGIISSVFGSQRVLNGQPRAWHNGVDIAAPVGTIIRAPADGVVRLAHPDMYFTGITLMIDHGFGLSTVYAHMSRADVKPGQSVKKGDPIGLVGKTGRATGPHLHWGMSLFSTHVDPSLLVPPMPTVSQN